MITVPLEHPGLVFSTDVETLMESRLTAQSKQSGSRASAVVATLRRRKALFSASSSSRQAADLEVWLRGSTEPHPELLGLNLKVSELLEPLSCCFWVSRAEPPYGFRH